MLFSIDLRDDLHQRLIKFLDLPDPIQKFRSLEQRFILPEPILKLPLQILGEPNLVVGKLLVRLLCNVQDIPDRYAVSGYFNVVHGQAFQFIKAVCPRNAI